MSKPLLARMKRPLWWVEQVVHMLLGLLITLSAKWGLGFIFDSDASGVIGTGLSTWVGGTREIVQNFGDDDGSLGDSIADHIGWTVGSILGGVI